LKRTAEFMPSLRDERAFLLAFRALKRTAKFMPSLRDEEGAHSRRNLGDEKL